MNCYSMVGNYDFTSDLIVPTDKNVTMDYFKFKH